MLLNGKRVFIAIVAVSCALGTSSALAKIKLHPGAIPGKVVHNAEARNLAYCEIAPVLGKRPNLIAQFYNTSEPGDHCPLKKMEAINPKMLAIELGADFVYMNPTPQSARRHWVMDQLWVFKAGEVVNFHGVKATWMASMLPKMMRGMIRKNFHPGEIHRESKYLFEKGRKVYLLRQPDGKKWVMQSYTNALDKHLTINKLPHLASKLKLPRRWKFEVKTLEKDLTIDPRKAGGVAHIIRDNLHDVYEGCGFDAACNYVP